MEIQSPNTQLPLSEIEELRARLAEVEETLDAIRTGSVDALVIEGTYGEQVYTLRGVDQTYRRLVEVMSEGAVVLTAEGDVLYCNRCFADMVKLSLEKVLGDTVRRFFSADDQVAMQTILDEALAGSGVRKLELPLRTGDGEAIPVYISATGLALDDVMAVCMVVTDLTEQKRSQQRMAAGMKRLEEEQLKANKLESLGLLAGGLAHDLNNTLTAILGNISLAKRSLRSNETALRRLSEAEAACKQARDVTQQLLTFAKGGEPVKETTSIAQLLQDWTGFALAGSQVDCKFALDPNLWHVDVDQGQMSRVINNLLINAQQSMPEGGTITIRAMNVTLGRQRSQNPPSLPLPAGDYVKIDVQDTGPGIPETHLSRIFDPYFTTKQEGSGLGLAITYSVVKAHDGLITVESQLGVGTTFHIYLPASSSIPDTSERIPEHAYPGRLRVLVMDDQASIKDLIRHILAEIQGAEVEFADDGLQAIELYEEAREAGRPIDIVLLDLTIPGGMGGKETISRLLDIDPNTKAIVFSGYSDGPILSKYQEYGFKGVIRKPFDIDEFLECLRVVAALSS